MKKLLFAGTIISLLLSSCATIFSGTKCKVTVKDGNPVNAKVYLNGAFQGDAPCKVKVSKNSLKAGAIIEIKADGYVPEKIVLVKKLKVAALFGDILTGVFWIAIDFADGAIYRAFPNKINYSLVLDENAKATNVVFKAGDAVYFTNDDYKNQGGIIKIVYVNRLVISFKKKPTDTKEQEVEVPYINVSKK